ncbi:MAG: hypothetical protein C5S49_03205 [Candidatus Methanogaster sp.]|nr:MAG: hypothetical protein C5S49_03205 [ANME-2 cluster archaeon]
MPTPVHANVVSVGGDTGSGSPCVVDPVGACCVLKIIRGRRSGVCQCHRCHRRKDAECCDIHADCVVSFIRIPRPVPVVPKPRGAVILPDRKARFIQTAHVSIGVTEVQVQPCPRTPVYGVDELADTMPSGRVSRGRVHAFERHIPAVGEGDCCAIQRVISEGGF